MLKIRLRRTGAKFQPTYRVVVADSRAPRDGAFVAILGYYNPRSNPPEIKIDETALQDWVRKGAQPTDSVLSVLRTGNLAPDLVTRFSKRMIGAGGKRGVDAPAAPAATTAPAATSFPLPSTAEAPTPPPVSAAAEAPAPVPAPAVPEAPAPQVTAPEATTTPDIAPSEG